MSILAIGFTFPALSTDIQGGLQADVSKLKKIMVFYISKFTCHLFYKLQWKIYSLLTITEYITDIKSYDH